MKFNEKVEALKNQAIEKITPESTQEDVQRVESIKSQLDELVKDYNALSEENNKFKDTIVHMVLRNGDDKPPVEDPSGHKPMSIEECLAEIQKQNKK